VGGATVIPSGQHPIPHATGIEPWRVQPLNPKAGGPREAHALWAWRLEDGAVVLQSDDGDVTIPADCLTSVANGLIAVHVHNGRPDVPGTRANQQKGS
jgi:hypothetical protein